MQASSSSSSASTPSRGSLGVSTRSGFPPGTPEPPINPPRRRSSLAFSQIIPQSPAPTAANSEMPLPVESRSTETPAQSFSNIGRKRALNSPLSRSTATPGHVAQMQKIFSNAKASLQLEMRYVASSTGSIESRLPLSQNTRIESSTGKDSPTTRTTSEGRPQGWRYSTIPFQLSNKNTDVREPFPEDSSRLPNPLCFGDDQSNLIVDEPISSGFTSPQDSYDHSEAMEDDPLLPQMPPTEALSAKQRTPLRLRNQDLNDDAVVPAVLLSIDLEQPLSDLKVDSAEDHVNDTVEDSPIISHLRRQGDTTTNQHLSTLLGNEIFLSTPARAAAESAKAKRGILKRTSHFSSNKENVAPGTDNSNSSSSHSCDGSTVPCPNPGVHSGLPVAICPDPSLHYHTNTPGWMAPPNVHLAPPLATPSYRNQSPLGAIFQPSAPQFHRASATGSPMPVMKAKSHPRSPRNSSFFSRSSYFCPPRQNGHPHSYQHNNRTGGTPSIADHFQPGWYYAASPAPSSEKMAYAFSTAAAKVVGSSPAPDSRIRDSYRTDTLTPLARPTSRFRKNGIGALTATRGVSKYYGHGGVQGLSMNRAADAADCRAGRTLDQTRFMSIPPKLSRGVPSGMAKRTQRNNRGDFLIVEDQTAGVARSNAASMVSGESVEPMEMDEDIRAAVRMSIGGIHDGLTDAVEEGVKILSPNVTPFRKGSEPDRNQRNSERRASYWDQDLKEVANSPAKKCKGRRSREVVSSPLRGEGVSYRGMDRAVSFNEEDLSGELEKAGDFLERRLRKCVDGRDEVENEVEMDGC